MRNSFIKKTALVLSVALSVEIMFGKVGISVNPKFAEAEEETEYLDLETEYHTQDEIREYYDNHPYSAGLATSYSNTPSYKSPYVVGNLTEECQINALNYLNIYRYIVGVGEAEIGELEQQRADAGAFILGATNQFTHSPTKPSDMDDDLYDLCYRGTQGSNVYSGGNLINAIESFISDPGTESRLGHRRGLLYSKMTKTGFGSCGCGLVYVSRNYFKDCLLAFPARNTPLEFFSENRLWDVMIPQTLDASTVKVKVTDTKYGKEWNFSSEDTSDGYFVVSDVIGNCCDVVFRPDGLELRDGDKYIVEVTGIPRPVRYEVNFFFLKEPVHMEDYKLSPPAYVYENNTDTSIEHDSEKRSGYISITPSNTRIKYVNFSSDNPDVAYARRTSAYYFEVIGLNPGKATITGVSEDGNITKSFEIEVLPRAQSIEMPDEITVGVGQTVQLYGNTLPEDTHSIIKYESIEDSSIATGSYSASYNGGRLSITGVSKGTTTVKAYAANNYAVTKTVTIKVVEPVPVTEIILEDITLDVGKQKQIVFSYLPNDITCKEFSCSLSGTYYATIYGQDIIKGNKAGTTTLTVSALDGSGISAKCRVIVKGWRDAPAAPTISSVTKKSISIQSISYYAEYSLDGIEWQSSSYFSNLTPGETYTVYQRLKETETYYASESSEGTVVTLPEEVKDMTLSSEDLELMVGSIVKLTATVIPENAGDTNVYFSSNYIYVASVDSEGNVSAKKGGNATIRATSRDNSKVVKECAVLCYLLGDVDCNNLVDASDLTVLARHVAKIESLTKRQAILSADATMDEKINAEDLTALARHVAKIEMLPQSQ